MRKQKIKWRIRNILKDGTVLKPWERLPVTEASLEAFRQYGEAALAALSRTEAGISHLCLDCTAGNRRHVAAKTARMGPHAWRKMHG